MLTTKNVSPKKAVEYFLQGYYQEGKSRWFGQGAEELGLVGAIDNEEVFKNIARGLSPDGTQQLSARHLKSEERRAALDCTFEAPKSVSLTALPGDDERLVEAHVKAVQLVLALMEQRCAHTRVTVDKTRQLVNAGNLVVAQFDHIESRELDPHLHTHCLVMNMVQTPDGKWYSHLNDAIVENKKYWGMVYQHFLAELVQELGYEIEWRRHGQFEIKGYTEAERMEFSKRRQQILAVVGPGSTWAEREEAWRLTRRRKEEVKPEELMLKWREEAELLGIKFVQPKQPQVEGQQSQEIVQPISNRLLDDAIRHCSEREVVFSQEDLGQFVLDAGITVDPRELGQLFSSHPELICLEPSKMLYTTQSALWRDRATVMLMQQGQGAVQAIAHLEAVEAHLEQTELNAGQRQAVTLAATTTDQFIVWQGVAGSGKTWALKELKAIVEAQGYTVKGFGITTDAEKELSNKAGVEATTVASLLCSKQPDQPQPNQIWFVDESGMLSAKDCYHLLQRAVQEEARVVLVGDTRQFSAVEAGNPFRLLQQEGIKTAYLEESKRQQNSPELKAAIDFIAQGNIEKGFTRLTESGRIVKCEASFQAAVIVAEYMKVPQELRAETLVLVGTHKQRLEITHAIRDALKAEGSLGQHSAKLTSLTSIESKSDMSKVKLEYTHNFELGNVVIPTRNYKRRRLEKGVAYEVVGKTPDELHLKSLDGKVLTVDPCFDKSVYRQQEIEIAVGDRLRWTRLNRKLERYGRDELVVTAIDGNIASIKYVGSDRTETIDLSQPQHLDYTVVRTNYSAQGKDADTVLIAADFTVSSESFYVAVSRAKQELKLFTQDPEEMVELAKESRANSTALDEWRKHIEQQMKAAAVVKPAVTTVEQPKQEHEAEPFTPPVKKPRQEHEPGSFTPPIKKQKQVVFNQSPIQLPVTPEWLAAGKRLYSQKHGWGEVEAVLGPRLIVKLDSGKQAHILEWPDAVNSKSIVPEPLQAFWTPNNTGVTPSNIEPAHWRELAHSSAIHPEIVARNFKSLQQDPVEWEHEAWGHLMYSDKLERSNAGRLSIGMLNRYTHIEAGGWWCGAGVDPRCFEQLQSGQKPKEKLWGCFKPNAPRESQDLPGKLIKYEHPPKTDLSIFLLDVPDEIANRVYKLADVEPSASDRTSGFWYCVWKYNLPIVLTEGAKKAACLLSQGHAAIGLPGIYAGYRSKDEQGNQIKAHLHEELAAFATQDRQIKICFDFETRSKTKRNIDIAISRTGSLLEREGAKVSVITLPGPDKGVDDFIVAQKPLAYERLDREALPLKDWRERNKQQQRTREKPAQNEREPYTQLLSDETKLSRPEAPARFERFHCRTPPQQPKQLSPEERKELLLVKLAQKMRMSQQTIGQFDGESLGKSIAEQLEGNREVEAQPDRVKPTRSSPRQQRQVNQPIFQPKPARVVSISTEQGHNEPRHEGQALYNFRLVESQEITQRGLGPHVGVFRRGMKVSDLLNSAIESDRLHQRQLERIEQQQHNADSKINAALAQVEKLSSKEQGTYPVTQPESPSLPKLEEIANVDPEQPRTIDATSLGRSIAASLAASDDQAQHNSTRSDELRRRTPRPERAHLSPGAVNPINYPIPQPRTDENQQHSRLSIPTSERTEAIGISSAQIQSDRRFERQLLQINQHLSTVNATTKSVVKRIADLSGDWLKADETTQRTIQGGRETERVIEGSREADPSVRGPQDMREALDDGREWVRIQTDRPQLSQWNDRVGFVVARLGGGQVYVAVGSYTPSFKNSELQPLNPQPKLEVQQAVKTEAKNQSPFPISSPAPLEQSYNEPAPHEREPYTQLLSDETKRQRHEAPAREEEVFPSSTRALNITQSQDKPNEQPDPQHSRAIDGTDIGRRASSRLKTDSPTTRLGRTAGDRAQSATRGVDPASSSPTPGLDELSSIAQRVEAADRPQRKVGATSQQLDRLQSTTNSTDRQLVKQVERSAADRGQVDRRISGLIQSNHGLERGNEQLKEPTTTPNRAMAPTAESAVRGVEQRYQPADHHLGQYVNSVTRRNTVRRGGIESTPGQTRAGVGAIDNRYQQVGDRVRSTYEGLAALADSVRSLPLEDVAAQLGLKPDKHDKHKWRGEGQIVSLTGQKFYDHLALKGGYGAIDLVMHIQRRSFKEALNWLSSGASSLLSLFERSQKQTTAPPESKTFQPPKPDENKWSQVRQYLVEKRGLPAPMVDGLHRDGKLYAAGVERAVLEKLRSKGYTHPERITNAVFLRFSDTGEITGASLRGVAEDSHFKGLATGSRKDQGWFTLSQGQGQLERIVLTESPIDAISAAAIAKSTSGTTMFIATDGTGGIPIDFLQQHQIAGVQIIAAHDADRAGEEMAWKVAQAIPGVTRAAPTRGKDWNEQLLGKCETSPDPDIIPGQNGQALLLQSFETTREIPNTGLVHFVGIPCNPSEWRRVTQVLGKSEAYINRIAAVVEFGKTLPEQELKAMQQDFNAYRQTSNDLWQWLLAALTLGKSEAYQKRIADVALTFHHPTSPSPLPENAVVTMQRDLLQYSQQLTQKLWQYYSQNADPNRPMTTSGVVAYAAMKDGYTGERLHRILEHDPQLMKIKQGAGESAAQNHVKLAVRNAQYKVRSHSQAQQHNQQLRHKQQPGLQL